MAKYTFNYSLKLVSMTYSQDEYGQEIPTRQEMEVLCDIRSIGRSEFYQSRNSKLQPSIIFIVKKFEYNGEREVIYDDEKYNVIRTYSTDIENIELTCEMVEHDS